MSCHSCERTDPRRIVFKRKKEFLVFCRAFLSAVFISIAIDIGGDREALSSETIPIVNVFEFIRDSKRH